MDCLCLIVGGHREHVHLLYRESSSRRPADVIKEMKRQSTIRMKENHYVPEDFRWQTGYGVFSISYWDLEKIQTYIQNQEIHHRKMTWDVEYRKLLERHGVEYDERYFLD